MLQVSLPELGPSLYVIRTQPSEYCLSTVESAALAMSIMEEDKSIVDKLVQPLKALCTFQLNYGAVEHQDKVTLLELRQYRKPVGKRTKKFLRQTAHKSVIEKIWMLLPFKLFSVLSTESNTPCKWEFLATSTLCSLFISPRSLYKCSSIWSMCGSKASIYMKIHVVIHIILFLINHNNPVPNKP